MTRPVVCSIGCSDPWNAAGVGLDVLALEASGVRPVTIVAGVTAQDRHGLQAAVAVDPATILAQFEALADAAIAVFRVGALLDAASVEVVAARLVAAGLPVVYDPALGPSGGGTFGDDKTRAAIAALLIPVATLVTPNLAEAETLTGLPQVRDVMEMERAGRALVAAGAGAALVKGGHLAGDACDVFVDAGGTKPYSAPRLAGDLRGTGCLLACGIAAALACGASMDVAIDSARAFVRERFATGVDIGGMRTAY